jgi:hypothetical protein
MNDKQIIILKAFEDELNKLAKETSVNYISKRDRPSAGAIGGLLGGVTGAKTGYIGGYFAGTKGRPAAMIAGTTLGALVGGKAGARLLGGKKRKYNTEKIGIIEDK